MSRFKEDSQVESKRLLANLLSENTEKNTKCGMKVFNEYLEMKKTNLDNIARDTKLLDETLSDFLCSVCKTDGNDYKKNSFMSLKNGIRRSLIRTYDVDISDNKVFKKSSEMYRAKLKDVKQILYTNLALIRRT